MNDEIKKYQVVSSGSVLKNFSIIGVSESLAKLYKIPAAEVIDTLICGKPRKVRSARSKAHAESICAKLQAMGLGCGVSEIRPDTPDDLSMHTHMVDPTDYDDIEDDIEPMSESTDEAMASIDAIYKDATNKVAKSKLIKRFSVVVIFLGIISVGSWYVLNQWLHTESSAELIETELAMEALGEPAAIAFADIAQARKLSTFSSIVGNGNGLQIGDLDGISKLLTPLNTLKVKSIFNNIDFLNASIYAKSSVELSSTNGWLMVLNGEFEQNKIVNELKTSFLIDSLSDDLYKLTLIDSANAGIDVAKQCVLTSATLNNEHEWFIAFTNTAIIVSSSAELNYRFQSKSTSLKLKSPESSSRLQQWQAYRDGSLISVKAFDPSLLDRNRSTEKFVRSTFGESSFETASLKIDSDLLSQEINASLEFTSENLESLDSSKQTLITNIAATQSKLSGEFPAINEVLSSLLVNQTEALILSAQVSGELISDINGISADLNNIVNDGVLSKPANTELLEFKSPTESWDFSDNITVFNSIQKRYVRPFEPLYKRQGVEIYIDSIGAKDHTKPSLNTIDLTAVKPLSKMSSIGAWDQSGIQQNFAISEIVNDKGQSLLGLNQCQLANQLNSGLNTQTVLSKDGFLKSVHSMPLISSASPNDIRRLKGRYELNVPVDVEHINVSMQANRKIVWSDGYFRLSRIQGSTVQYRLSGNIQNLLAVRALNNEGKVLSEHTLKTDGDITTVSFNGRVDSLDVYMANKWQTEKFEFTLNSIQAKPTNKNNAKSLIRAINPFEKSDRAKFRKRISSERALALWPSDKGELGRMQTKTSQLIFNLESDNNIPSKLTGYIVIPFNELLLVEQDALNVYLEINKKYKAEFKPNFKKANSVFNDSGKQYLKGEFSINIDKDIDQIDHIKGTLNFALPSKFSRRVATIGRVSEKDLRLLSYDFGDNPASTYQITKEYDIGFLTAKSGVTYLAEKTSSNSLKFTDFVGEPKKIELLNVSKRSRFSEKFTLTVAN